MDTTQLYEYECWYCHQIVGGTHNVPPRSPCPHCGVYWGVDYGPKVIHVGPAGAHTPEGITSTVSLERLLIILSKVFEGFREEGEEHVTEK